MNIHTAGRGQAATQLKLRIGFLLAFAWFLLACSSLLAQSRHEGGDVAVVTNRDLPVAGLTLYEVKQIFLGETRYWKNDLTVVLIVPPMGTHEREVLLRRVYHMNEAQYKRYWIERILRGEAISPPKTAESIAVAGKLALSFKGCITVMNNNDVPVGKNLKILKIDGKLPGEREYPLR